MQSVANVKCLLTNESKIHHCAADWIGQISDLAFGADRLCDLINFMFSFVLLCARVEVKAAAWLRYGRNTFWNRKTIDTGSRCRRVIIMRAWQPSTTWCLKCCRNDRG